MRPIDAAKKLAKLIEQAYGVMPDVWNKAKCKEVGRRAEACINCEEVGVDVAEEQAWERGAFKDGMNSFEGVLIEPANSYLLCLYKD